MPWIVRLVRPATGETVHVRPSSQMRLPYILPATSPAVTTIPYAHAPYFYQHLRIPGDNADTSPMLVALNGRRAGDVARALEVAADACGLTTRPGEALGELARWAEECPEAVFEVAHEYD